MTLSKRLFDLGLALLALPVLLLLTVVVALVLLLVQGRPVFYGSERMKTPGQGFTLWKFRTMSVAAEDSGVTGGDKAARITPAGALLRRTRLDELPQVYNILRGDMSFVGPRPPLREYVERFPELYAQVLRSRPGITGLATLKYHAHEARLLQRCDSAAETDAVYARICVPAKARLDLIYQSHQGLCFDFAILLQTLSKILRRKADNQG